MGTPALGTVRIGARPTLEIVGLWIGLSFFFAWGMTSIAVPILTAAAAEAMSPPILGAIFFAVGLGWIGLLLYRYTPSRGIIDLSARTLKSGWRTVPFDEVQHVYRVPGGASPDDFGIRIAVRGGPDVRVIMNSARLVNAEVDEVQALITLVEAAPIVPDTRVPLRPPLSTELGHRSDHELRSDASAYVSMLYYDASYAKATLLLELRHVAARLDSDGTGETPQLPAGSAAQMLVRELLLAAGQQPEGQPGKLSVANATATVGNWSVDYSRGFFGTLNPTFKQTQRVTEEWLLEADPSYAPDKQRRVVLLGWAILLSVALWPVSLVVAFLAAILLPQAVASIAATGAAMGLVFAPVSIWAAFVFFWLARVRRHRALRTAVLAVRSRREVPDEIRTHFGSPHPEGYIELPLALVLVFVWIVVITNGIMLILFGLAPAGSSAAYLVPVGIALVLLSFWIFRIIVRRIARRQVSSLLGELDYRMMARRQ